jgi:FAD/FMN-containing dehydrogenase
MPAASSANDLKPRLRGELIEPQDPGYDSARKVYNGMIDRRPLAIARCADVADVMACVNFARERELLLAVRAGGHNFVSASVSGADDKAARSVQLRK